MLTPNYNIKVTHSTFCTTYYGNIVVMGPQFKFDGRAIEKVHWWATKLIPSFMTIHVKMDCTYSAKILEKI